MEDQEQAAPPGGPQCETGDHRFSRTMRRVFVSKDTQIFWQTCRRCSCIQVRKIKALQDQQGNIHLRQFVEVVVPENMPAPAA